MAMSNAELCSYLKHKIADKEKEIKEYSLIANQLPHDVSKHGYVPLLLDAQQKEMQWLQALYGKMCVGTVAKQYAIWYAQSSEDEFMPASGSSKFPVKVVYSSLPEAKEVAENLARRYMKTIFKVYPVNQNYEINGKLLFGRK